MGVRFDYVVLRNTNARPSLNNDTANVRSGEIVQGKYDYEVLRRLGSGSNGITYAANTLSGPQTGEEVAIKVLSLRGSRDWKVSCSIFEDLGSFLIIGSYSWENTQQRMFFWKRQNYRV